MENKKEGLSDTSLQSETKLTPAQEIAKLNQETVQNTLNRREFYARLSSRHKEDPEEELAKVRDQLVDDKDSVEPENDKEEEKEVPPQKKKRKIMNRRNFLTALGISAAGVFVTYNWDYVKRWMHHLERKEMPKGLAGVIEGIKDEYVHVDQGADAEMWAREIENAFQTSGLPRTTENLAMVLALIAAESGFRAVPRVYDYVGVLSEDGLNLVKGTSTGGPMELGYQHVMNSEHLTEEEAKELMRNIPEGLRLSYAHLNEILKAYSFMENKELRLQCIFADWNSGTYSSRNAGFQSALSELSGKELKFDGLIGDKTKELVASILNERNVSVGSLEEDLKRNRSANFSSSDTWRAIENLLGKPITPVVANTPVLGLYGTTKKITTGVGNSLEFAQARYEEFDKISEIMNKFEVN